jgi:hypothetical protein
MSRVASIVGCRRRRGDQSQGTRDLCADGASRVAVCRVAGVGSLSSGGHERKSALSRDTLSSVGIAVCWVACILGGRRRRSDQSQRARDLCADGAGRVAVGGVAGVGGLRSRSNQAQSTVCGNTLDTFRVLVCRVASIGSLSSGSGCDETQSTVCRDTLDTSRVLVCRVASIGSLSSGSGCNEAQSSVGRNTLDTLRVLMSRVASIRQSKSLRSGEEREDSGGLEGVHVCGSVDSKIE